MLNTHDPFRPQFRGAAKNYDYLIGRPHNPYDPPRAARAALDALTKTLEPLLPEPDSPRAGAGD